jgi:hypothetical protein
MADGVVVETTPQDTETVTEVTNDALSSAWDATQGKEVDEVVTEVAIEETAVEEEPPESVENEPDIPEEPTDNASRSQLGRKVKGIEDSLGKIQQMIESLSAGNPVQAQTQTAQTVTPYTKKEITDYVNTFVSQKVQEAVERGELPENPFSAAEITAVQNFVADTREAAKEAVEQQAKVNFTREYLTVLKSPELKGETPDDLHAEIMAAVMDLEGPFNNATYGNPTIDARINYLEAKTAILGGKTKPAVKNVFKGKDKDTATGTHITTKVTQVVDDLPALDEVSLQFAKSQGMSEESIRKALKGSMPVHLRGRL